MVTPDFEEWLMRQDVPIEYTTDIDRYIRYLTEEIGLVNGSLDVARGVYPQRFDYFATLGIRAFELVREYEGIPYRETRYGIKGYAGAWGYERMMEIAEDIAEEIGETEIAEWVRIKREGGS